MNMKHCRGVFILKDNGMFQIKCIVRIKRQSQPQLIVMH